MEHSYVREIQLMRREANKSADILAKNAFNLSFMHWVNLLFLFCMQLMKCFGLISELSEFYAWAEIHPARAKVKFGPGKKFSAWVARATGDLPCSLKFLPGRAEINPARAAWKQSSLSEAFTRVSLNFARAVGQGTKHYLSCF